MKVSEYYETDRYKDVFIKDRLAYYSERLKAFSEILGERKFSTVLDAGCGDGGLLKEMQKKWEFDAYGLDISKNGTDRAKKNGIKAKVADLSKKFPFNDEIKFDLIIANELIEHLNDPDLFLRECNRVLARDGLLIIGTPNLNFWLNRILFLFGIYPMFLEASTEKKIGMGKLSALSHGNQPVGHVHMFNLLAIEEILEMNSFSVEKVIGLPIFFETPNILVTTLYKIVDSFFSLFPSLSPDLIVLARKK